MPDLNDGAFTAVKVYPNPFNRELKIEFTQAEADNLQIDIYDIRGSKVRSIEQLFNEGHHIITWDGKGEAGEKVVSGIIFYPFYQP